MTSIDEQIKELLARRDPNGYYIVPSDKSGIDIVKRFYSDVEFEEVGDIVFIKTRSRRVAERIARILIQKGLIKSM
ncbi:MAG: hypothetical protein QW632_04190 [Ignisphaera sp.]